MIQHKLKYLPNGEPDYDSPIPPPPPPKTVDQCKQVCDEALKHRRAGFDPEKKGAENYCWHRVSWHHLMGDQAAAMDIDRAIAEYEAGQS